MKFDRQIFFAEYKRLFGSVDNYQVKGLERLLWGYETYYGWWDSIPQTANSLAQIKHETAHSFNPVVEGYYLARTTPPDFQGKTARVREFQKSLWYYPYFGVGDIQLTHRENYAEQDELLKKYFPEVVEEFERRTGQQEFNLVKNPYQMLDGKISFCVMTVGMHKGTFREGHYLDRYINSRDVDHFSARNIVNGDRFYKDKQGVRIGDKIAADAKRFDHILRRSLTDEVTPQNVAEKIDSLIKVNKASTTPTNSPETAATGEYPFKLDPSSEIVEKPSDTMEPIRNGINGVPTENSANDESSEARQEQERPSVIGDAPEAAPRAWIRVEDLKPFVLKSLKRVWGWFSALNTAQLPTLTGLGLQFGGDYWWLWILFGVFVFVFLFIAAVIASTVLGLIWWINRGEINSAHKLVAESVKDPGKYNLGLKVEKIGVSPKSFINGIDFSGEAR